MQLSLSFADFGKALEETAMLDASLRLTDDILDNFRRPDRQACVEYLQLDNTPCPAPLGTYMGPGHGIETAWFQLENLRGRSDLLTKRLPAILDIMRWSFEKGWDEEFGGLYLGVDIDGGQAYLDNADTKIWWPHCEALCGSLLAFEVSGESWCIDWYNRTHDYASSHFPDRKHGEWTQRLDRQGKRIETVVALPVKDPFHLPRAVIYAIEILERLAQRGGAES